MLTTNQSSVIGNSMNLQLTRSPSQPNYDNNPSSKTDNSLKTNLAATMNSYYNDGSFNRTATNYFT